MQNNKTIMTMALAFSLGAWGASVPNALANPMPPQAKQANAVAITGAPSVANMSGNSATVTWQTNVSSASRVHYGTDPNNLSQDATAAWGGTTHNVTLKKLQPGKTYYYKVESGNASGSGTTVSSSVQQFQFNGQNAGNGGNTGGQNGGQTLPGEQPSTKTDNVVILAGPMVQNLTGSSATLWWQTDDVAATDVKYGTSSNQMNLRAYERGGDRNHTAELTNLQPGQTYFWQMLRRDGTVRTTGQFVTPRTNAANSGNPNNNGGQYQYPGGAQVTNGPVMGYVGPNSATVQWSTAQPASSIVRYGSDPNNLSQMAQGAQGSTTHQVQLNGLQPNTRYYFMVMAQDSVNGQMAQGYPGQFQTVNQGQQPVTIFGIPVTPRR